MNSSPSHEGQSAIGLPNEDCEANLLVCTVLGKTGRFCPSFSFFVLHWPLTGCFLSQVLFGVVYYNFRTFNGGSSDLQAALTRVMGSSNEHVAAALDPEFRIEIKEPPTDLPIVRDRKMMYKRDGSGYLLQHPLNDKYWIEFNKKFPDSAVAWKATATPVIGSLFSASLSDVSLPKLGKPSQLKMEVTLSDKSSGEGEWVAVGDVAKTVRGNKVEPLVCFRATGCRYELKTKARHELRTLYKLNGGAMQESMDGQVWVESNADGGDYAFKFGTVLATKEFILLLDASRDMWLKITPPPNYNDEAYIRSRVFMGESKEYLDEASLSDDHSAEQVMKAKDDGYSPWNLLFESCDPRKTCSHVRRKIDAKRKALNLGPPIHMVFSVDQGARYEWLSLAFQYWWKRTQKWKEKGSRFTRLLSTKSGGPDHLMDEIPTFVSPLPEEFGKGDHYLPYNKIVSVYHWTRSQEFKDLPAGQVIAIMDVDIVLLDDLSHYALDVGPGRPLGAKGFMAFTGEASMYDKVITRYCPTCNSAAPLAVPYILVKEDLAKLAPEWYDMCRKIRKDTTPWSEVKDWRANSPIQLSWTAEQWAFLLSASEQGLKFDVREDLSAFTSEAVQKLGGEPMIHFSDWTVGKSATSIMPQKWSKGSADCLSDKNLPIPDPSKGEVSVAMLEALWDFKRDVWDPRKKR